MAAKRDPWQPLGTLIYHLMVAGARFGLSVHGGTPVTRDYEQDPEPRWLFCDNCGHSTFWEPYRWVLEGDTDWECDQCGAVTSG